MLRPAYPARQDAPASQKPLSIVELADMATIPFKPEQPLKRYLVALKQILQESKVYESEGNADMAFVFLVKVSRLINEYLPTHPEWGSTSEALKSQLQKESNAVDAKISELKGRIHQRYEQWEQRRARGQTSPTSLTLRESQAHGTRNVPVAPVSAPRPSAPALPAATMPLPGEGDDDGLIAQPIPQQIQPHVTPAYRMAAPPVWSVPPVSAPTYFQTRSWTYPGFAQQSAAVAAPSAPIWQPTIALPPPVPAPPPIPPLPSALAATKVQDDKKQSEPPAIPPAPSIASSLFSSGSLGGLPLSLVKPTWAKRVAAVASAPFQAWTSAVEPDADHEQSKPDYPIEEEQVDSGACTEGGQPLRTIVVPSELIPTFEKMASKNTKARIETCGLLMGKLARNQFTVTHLLVPKQHGTSETCTTTHEEEQMSYQEKHDLMTLGWIHTHPTQSCFMSSLDLHTHSSYQLMLPEAIAIVVAPTREPHFGIFRLTDPPGLDTIVTCTQKGVFHPHPDLPIYTDCEGDFAHVSMRKNISLLGTDLR